MADFYLVATQPAAPRAGCANADATLSKSVGAGQESASLRNGCSSGGRSVLLSMAAAKRFVALGPVDQFDEADLGKAGALVVGDLAGGLGRAATHQDIRYGFADQRAAGNRGKMLFAL